MIDATWSEPAIPILLYHAVNTEASSWIAPFTIRPATFARHLDIVEASGRTAITVDELGAAIELGRADRLVLITFDDGFADLEHTVAPLLQAKAMPATMYLTTGFVGGTSPGGDPMISWSAAAELAAAGHQLGAHSVNHPQLDIQPAALAAAEIRDSRNKLEDRLQLPIGSFAYPHGYSGPAVRRITKDLGYDTACGVKNALSHPADDRMALARLMITNSTTDRQLAGWLAGRGAPMAGGDRLRTVGWRSYRRLRSWLPSRPRRGSPTGPSTPDDRSPRAHLPH